MRLMSQAYGAQAGPACCEVRHARGSCARSHRQSRLARPIIGDARQSFRKVSADSSRLRPIRPEYAAWQMHCVWARSQCVTEQRQTSPHKLHSSLRKIRHDAPEHPASSPRRSEVRDEDSGALHGGAGRRYGPRRPSLSGRRCRAGRRGSHCDPARVRCTHRPLLRRPRASARQLRTTPASAPGPAAALRAASAVR